MEDDIFSTTNVSLIEEFDSARQLTSSPVSISKNNKNNSSSTSSKSSKNNNSSNSSEQWNVVETPFEDSVELANKEKPAKSNFSMPLKHQENTVDILKKENFDLRLKIYFLETRLQDLSPTNLENALKENVDLKVTVQKLSQELKKYKKIILELNAALEIVNKPCPKQHGMSQEERDELKAAVSEVEKYHEENDRLSKMVADISAENVRLRATLRSAKSEHDETDIYRKYRQAQITIQEQQQQIQSLQSKINSSRQYNEDYSTLNKLKRLEEELRVQRLETDAIINELEEKKKQIKDLKNEMNGYTKILNDTKQQLETKTTELEKLSKENSNNEEKLIENIEQLKEENEVLVTEIQNREQEVAALEEEIIKLLSHFEENNQNRPINSYQNDEKNMLLEAAIQERDEKISMLTEELQNMNKSHDEDIEALDEHITKTQQALEEKDEANRKLLVELNRFAEKEEEIRKEYEEKLDELTVTIREREVRIATLEGNFEAQTDTMQREKELLKEEIEELKHKLHLVFQELNEKENQVLELRDVITKKRMDNTELMKMKKSVQNDEKWKERALNLEHKLKDQLTAYRALKHKWVMANDKNEILNKLLDQSRKDAEGTLRSNKTEQMLQRLNYELRKDLEDKSRDYEQVKMKLDELQNIYNEQIEMNKDLTKQLQRRENMLTHSLSTFDTLKEHKEFMENILYEQATGSHSFRERSESVILKQ